MERPVYILVYKGWKAFLAIALQDAGMRAATGLQIPMWQKVLTLFAALFAWAREGFKLATKSAYSARMSICKRHAGDCYSSTPIPHCLRCGCSSAKLRLPKSTCPRGFW